MTKHITIAVLLAASLSACLDAPATGAAQNELEVPPFPPADPRAPNIGPAQVGVSPATAADPRVMKVEHAVDAAPSGDYCGLLPTDDADPCAHLCDADGVSSFIPPGTCVTFVCQLSDGTVIRAGGCS